MPAQHGTLLPQGNLQSVDLNPALSATEAWSRSSSGTSAAAAPREESPFLEREPRKTPLEVWLSWPASMSPSRSACPQGSER